MVDVNCIVCTGRASTNSEFKRTKSNKILTLFSIAVSDDYKKDDEWVNRCYFFNVIYPGEKELEKGTPVTVEGKLIMEKAVVNETTRYFYKIVADRIIVGRQMPKPKENKEFEEDYKKLQEVREAQKQAKQQSQEDDQEEIPF